MNACEGLCCRYDRLPAAAAAKELRTMDCPYRRITLLHTSASVPTKTGNKQELNEIHYHCKQEHRPFLGNRSGWRSSGDEDVAEASGVIGAALSAGLNVLRTHLRSDHSDHIRRLSWPHVFTFLQKYECKCVLSHNEQPPTSLTPQVFCHSRIHF